MCVCFISLRLACPWKGDFDDHNSIDVSITNTVLLSSAEISFKFSTKVVSSVFSRGLPFVSSSEYHGSRVALPPAVYFFRKCHQSRLSLVIFIDILFLPLYSTQSPWFNDQSRQIQRLGADLLVWISVGCIEWMLPTFNSRSKWQHAFLAFADHVGILCSRCRLCVACLSTPFAVFGETYQNVLSVLLFNIVHSTSLQLGTEQFIAFYYGI